MHRDLQNTTDEMMKSSYRGQTEILRQLHDQSKWPLDWLLDIASQGKGK